MRAPASLLLSPSPSSASLPPPDLPHGHGQAAGEQQAISVDSDMVVILASLLCALICMAGLALVARCACRSRRASGVSAVATSSSSSSTSCQQPPKGLRKKAIEALPTVSLEEGGGGSRIIDGCAICLADFTQGDELRVLPHCGHSFHVACIDTWLGAHASCPSCRATVAVTESRCRRCGANYCDLDDAAAEHAAAAAEAATRP